MLRKNHATCQWQEDGAPTNGWPRDAKQLAGKVKLELVKTVWGSKKKKLRVRDLKDSGEDGSIPEDSTPICVARTHRSIHNWICPTATKRLAWVSWGLNSLVLFTILPILSSPFLWLSFYISIQVCTLISWDFADPYCLACCFVKIESQTVLVITFFSLRLFHY